MSKLLRCAATLLLVLILATRGINTVLAYDDGTTEPVALFSRLTPDVEQDDGDDDNNAGSITYIVSPGDTLTRIAAQHGVSIQALVEANSIPDANRINVGQRLTIPTRQFGNDVPYDDGIDTPATTDGIDTPYTDGIDTPYTDGIDTPYTDGIDTPATTDGIDTPATTDGIDTPYTDGIDTPATTDGIDTPYTDGIDTPATTDGIDTPYTDGIDTPPTPDSDDDRDDDSDDDSDSD